MLSLASGSVMLKLRWCLEGWVRKRIWDVTGWCGIVGAARTVCFCLGCFVVFVEV